jgi:hypothetical protein
MLKGGFRLELAVNPAARASTARGLRFSVTVR